MKKSYFKFISIAMISILLLGCASTSDNSKGKSNSKTLIIGASPSPHGEILNFAKENLKSKGIDIQVKIFTDYVIPNKSLVSGELDANYFQHVPYMDDFNKKNNTNIVSIGGIHAEPLAAYSNKIKKIDELKSGDIIAIPNDNSNGTRALKLLEKNNLITLKNSNSDIQTEKDIDKNPKNIKIKTVEAAQLPRLLDEVSLTIINGNYALASNLDTSNVLFLEEISDIEKHVNIIATREDNKNNETLKELVNFLKSDKTKNFIKDKYGKAVIPSN